VKEQMIRIPNRMQTLRCGRAAVPALLLMLGVACGNTGDSRTAREPLTEDMSRGPVQVVVSADPGKVHLDRDVLLTVTITAPSGIAVTLPSLEDRLNGFVLSGTFDEEPAAHGGETTWTRHARLSPVLSDEYRLAPMAIVYTDSRGGPAKPSWFPTRTLRFEPVPPSSRPVPPDIEVSLAPVWIHPPFKTVALYVLLTLAVLVILFLLGRLARKVRHNIKIRQMSARERALRELSALLAKDLIAKDLVKEFYVQLTMIVRRYIERQHAVRAPEQTTEEFLVAVSNDPRFGAEVARRLKTFLVAADLVKFAAHRPESEAVDQAIRTAREYVETEAGGAASGAAPGGS